MRAVQAILGQGRLLVADKRHGGVIFDVDGTLLDANDLHVVAWWSFTERGHDIRCADVHRAIGMGSAELWNGSSAAPIPR